MMIPEQYQASVAEARMLVKRSEADQWRLAQLTWEVVEGGMSRKQWAHAIGVDPSYAGRLYQMWEAQEGVDAVNRPLFSDAYRELVPSSHSPYVPLDQRETTETTAQISDLPSTPDMLGIYTSLAEARRYIRSAFRQAVALDPADNVKMSLLDELGDIDTEIGHFRKFLTGMGVEEFIDQIMDGA